MPTVVTTDIVKVKSQLSEVGTNTFTNINVRVVAAYNPVVIRMTRKDVLSSMIQSTWSAFFFMVDMGAESVECVVDSKIYVKASVFDGVYTVLNVTGNNVTIDAPFNAFGPYAGYFNILSRVNWYLVLRVKKGTTGSGFRDLRFYPDITGFMTCEVSGALRSFIDLDYGDEVLNTITSDLNLSNYFGFSWLEKWVGSDNEFNNSYAPTVPQKPQYIAGAFKIGDPNNGFYIKYFANTSTPDDGSPPAFMPKWLTAFEKPIYYAGLPFIKNWAQNANLGAPNQYVLIKKYFNSALNLISTDTYPFVGVGYFSGLGKIRIQDDPTVAVYPDQRRFVGLTIFKTDADKEVIDYLLCHYVPVALQNCNQFYLRWLNPLGGFDYYLFETNIFESQKVEGLGEYEDYFNSIAATTEYQNWIGKKTTEVVRVGTQVFDENVGAALKTLAASPLVSYYNTNTNVWIGVRIQPGSFQYRKTKQQYNSVELTIELPSEFNQTA